MKNKAGSRTKAKNDIRFKERPNGHFRFDASFTYKSLSCRVQGTWDPDLKEPGPVKIALKVGRKPVFAMAMADHNRGGAAHIKFGTSVKGTKQLFLLHERIDNVNFISGTADGEPLLPLRFEGCACKDGELGRPALATLQGNRIAAVSVMPETPLPPKEIDGLVAAMRRSMDTFGSGLGSIIGDIFDGGRYVLCILGCLLEYVVCLGRASQTPGGGTLAQICTVILMACRTNCRIRILL